MHPGEAMADELLSSIIRLENDIQKQLKSEQLRADAWLARVRADEEEQLLRISTEREEADRTALREARQRAEEESAAIERREAKRCRRLEAFDDQELAEILQRYLVKVLPGRADDCQDVQG
jgi:hypothetical protein